MMSSFKEKRKRSVADIEPALGGSPGGTNSNSD